MTITRMLFEQCRAELLRLFRNSSYVLWSLLMPIGFYAVFTRGMDAGSSPDASWASLYLMSMTSFSVMGSSIMTFGIRLVQERKYGWAVYMQTTPLPGWIFFSGKIISQTVMHVLSVAVIFTAGYLINGVSLSVFQWLGAGLWIVLASLPFLALGAVIGGMRRVDTASGIANVVNLLLALAGGLWNPPESMPVYLRQLGYWLPSRHLGSGAWNIVRGAGPGMDSVAILLGWFVLFMLLSLYIRNKQEAVCTV